jgi:uncharacterized membrane protein
VSDTSRRKAPGWLWLVLGILWLVAVVAVLLYVFDRLGAVVW